MRFLFLADCQLGAYATFSGMTADDVAAFAARDMRVAMVPEVEGFAWEAVRYRQAIATANQLQPAFVVLGGDMTHNPGADDQLDELLAITADLDADIPMHWVPGNHDIAPDWLIPTAASIGRYRDRFGPDYYSFTAGGTRFIALDTVVIDHPEHVPDDYEEQLAWLRRELATATAAGQRIVLLGHHPLFTATPDEEDTYWNLPRERRSLLLELIHHHDVRIGFAGHWHRNAIAFDGRFEMVTSGPVGYPLGDDPSGFRVVDVTAEGVRHEYHPLPETGRDDIR